MRLGWGIYIRIDIDESVASRCLLVIVDSPVDACTEQDCGHYESTESGHFQN